MESDPEASTRTMEQKELLLPTRPALAQNTHSKPKTKWWRVILPRIITLLPAAIILTFSVVPIVLLIITDSQYLIHTQIEYLYGGYCDVSLPWSSWGALFDINFRTGIMSFASAKGIDIVWDLVVGQGGRVVLAWVAWHVFGEAITRHMEENAISYEVFASVAFSNDYETLKAILQSFFRKGTWRLRFLLAWILVSIIYLVFFPVVLSASTSYVTVTQHAIRLVDNETVLATQFTNNTATISVDYHNGSGPWGTGPWLVPMDLWRGGKVFCSK